MLDATLDTHHPTAPDPEFAPPERAVADFTPPDEHPAGAGSDEHLGDSVAAQALYDRAVRESEGGRAEEAVVHFLRASKLAEAAREWYLTAAACHRVGDVFSNPGGHSDLARAVRVYHRAVAAYQQCGLFSEARQLTYRIARLQLWRGRELGLSAAQRVELFLFWLVAGFGLRPGRVLLTGAAVVLAYALTYWLTGGVSLQTGEPAAGDFATALYFSGITFTTVGFGDLVPAPHARMIAMSEGMVGFVLVSFFVVVLANRLRT